MKNLVLFIFLFALLIVCFDTQLIEILLRKFNIYCSMSGPYFEPLMLILIYLKLRDKK